MPKRKRNSINTPFARTIIFSGVILLLVAFLLMRLETVSTWIGTILSTLRPVIIGAVITLVLHTPVRRLEGFFKHITKGKRFPCSAVAVILSYLLLFSVLAGIVCIIVPQFSQSLVDFADQFTIYFINFQKFLQTYSTKGQQLYELMQQVGLDFAQLKSWLTDLSVTVSSYIPNLMEKIGTWATSLVSIVVDCFIGLIFSLYMLSGKKRLKAQAKRILQKAFSKENYHRISHYGNITFEIFSNFVGGQLMDACILGLLCFIGMSIFHFQYPVLISVIIGLTNMIPIVGPIVGTVPCALILLLVEPKQAIWFVVFVIVIQQIDSNLIYPRVVGGSVGLPAMWVLFAVIVGGGLFGVLGMVLGVPVMSLIYVILREKTLPEGEVPPSPLQMPERTAMEQRANEWFGKMRDTVFTTVTDTVKRNWQHHEEDDDSATEEPMEKDMKSAESTVSETPISVILEQTDEEGCEIHPAASESESRIQILRNNRRNRTHKMKKSGLQSCILSAGFCRKIYRLLNGRNDVSHGKTQKAAHDHSLESDCAG